MRIISQNGNVDIPYIKARIVHANNQVIASVGAWDYTMGVYSSNEKAYKAMEMLRDKYLREKSYDDGKGGVLYATRNSSMSTVFQFPKDDEIEV